MPLSLKLVPPLADIILETVPEENKSETKLVVYSILTKPLAVKEKLRQLASILNDGLSYSKWPGEHPLFEDKP